MSVLKTHTVYMQQVASIQTHIILFNVLPGVPPKAAAVTVQEVELAIHSPEVNAWVRFSMEGS